MKRLCDIIISVIAFGIFIVPSAIIGLLIMLDSKGPAFYWSRRIGRNGVPFMIPKFRTMYVNAPERPTENLTNPEIYITRIGRLLRATSLDEIPQFFSVLRGDMSLVGPRPVLVSQIELNQMRADLGIHRLRPGITGWAQINGRDDISIEDKVRLDWEYLERQSFCFDLLIIWKTCFYVVRQKGVWH